MVPPAAGTQVENLRHRERGTGYIRRLTEASPRSFTGEFTRALRTVRRDTGLGCFGGAMMPSSGPAEAGAPNPQQDPGRRCRTLPTVRHYRSIIVDKVKIGIIGVGQIGKAHLHHYQNLPVEIVAAADVSEAGLKEAAAQYQIPRTFTDFRKLLEMDEIQAVDVCLHNNLHTPVTSAALQAGKHVYCEKPIAGSWVDGKKMVETAKQAGQMLSIQLATLFSLETKAAQRLITEGFLGDIYYAKSYGHRRRGRPYVDGYGTSSFVQQPIAGGGALFDMGVYHIAQILHLLDNPRIETVSGATHQALPMYQDRRENGKYSVEELGLGMARLAGGITLFIEESWAIHNAGQDSGQILRLERRLSPLSVHLLLDGGRYGNGRDLRSAQRGRPLALLPPELRLPRQPAAPLGSRAAGRAPLIDTAGPRARDDVHQRRDLSLEQARPGGHRGRDRGRVGVYRAGVVGIRDWGFGNGPRASSEVSPTQELRVPLEARRLCVRRVSSIPTLFTAPPSCSAVAASRYERSRARDSRVFSSPVEPRAMDRNRR